MADTIIILEIVKSDTVPVPQAGDTIPWCIALATRASNPKNRNGHRQKKRGYYYRYSGGNTTWDDGTTPISDGDFAFPQSDHANSNPIKLIDIEFNENTEGWKFDDLKDLEEGTPLKFKISEYKDKVLISDDTSKLEVVSGNFGVVVKKGDVEIYCDPNWQNV